LDLVCHGVGWILGRGSRQNPFWFLAVVVMTHPVFPKPFFLTVLLLFFMLIIADHLTSPTMRSTGAPADIGNACAPCGAPCK
jgi:hypothetical protein